MDALAGAKISIPSAATLFWLLLPVYGFDGWRMSAAGVFILVGLFFPVAVTLLSYEANRRMGPTVAGTIGSTAPLFAVLGAVLFLEETLGVRQIVATAAIVLGSIALVPRGGSAGFAASSTWIPWSAAALRALAQLIAKTGLLLWPNPYAATLIGYTVSATMIWSIAVFSRRAETRVYTQRGVLWFALTGLLNGAAVLALYTALGSGTVNLVSPIVATYPVFTLVLNALVLRQERVSVRLIAGVILTVAGVIVLVAS